MLHDTSFPARGGRAALYALAATLALGVALGFLLGWRDARHAPAPVPTTGSPPPLAEPATRSTPEFVPAPESRVALEGAVTSIPKKTARAVIRESFGNEADEAIARLEKKGWDLDRLGPPELTWDEARAKLAERVLPTENEEASARQVVTGLPADVTSRWLRERFALGEPEISDETLALVKSIAAEYEGELGRIADDYAALRRTYVQRAWDTGNVRVRPFTIWGHGPEAAYVKTDGGYGWAYTLVLTYEENAGLRELRDEAAPIARARDERIRTALRQH